MLEINCLLKFAEEDVYNEGCQTGTASSYSVDVSFKAETQKEIIAKVCDFLCIENNKENYLLNSCDEVGRIDFQLMEDGDGARATEREIKEWKKGKIKLWYVEYSAYVEQVKRKSFKLKD